MGGKRVAPASEVDRVNWCDLDDLDEECLSKLLSRFVFRDFETGTGIPERPLNERYPSADLEIRERFE